MAVLSGLVCLTFATHARAEGDLVTVITNVRNITTETFTATSGDVLDGCISPGTHRVLRFDFSSRNVGDGAVVAGTVPPRVCATCPCSTSPISGSYVWSNAHCHWHLRDFNTYSLTAPTNGLVRSGFKQAFCLEDTTKWNPSAGGRVYNCVNQGVSPGWQDTYGSNLPCQFINVDGVGNGDYRLVATTNAAPTVTEANIHNNTVSIALRVSGNTVTAIGSAWQPRKTIAAASSITAPPALASWGPNRLDAFWTDGQLKHLWYRFGTWSGPEALGTPPGVTLTSSPSAVSWAPNRIDIVARGNDSRLWHTWWDGTRWGGWDNPGSVSGLASAPTVTSWGPNRLDIAWIDSSGSLGHIAWQNAWFPPDNLGRPPGVTLTNEPRSVSWQRDRLDIVASGSDRRLWHMWWQGAWGAWDNPGDVSTVGGRPDIVSWGPNRLDIFWPASSGNAQQHIAWYGTWGPIDTLSGPAGTSINTWPTVTAWGPNRLDVFVRGSDNRLWHQWWDGIGWGGAWETTHSNNDVVSTPYATSWAQNQLSIIHGANGNNMGAATWF